MVYRCLNPLADLVDESGHIRACCGEVPRLLFIEIAGHECHVERQANSGDRGRNVIVELASESDPLSLNRDYSEFLEQDVVVDSETDGFDGARDCGDLRIIEV